MVCNKYMHVGPLDYMNRYYAGDGEFSDIIPRPKDSASNKAVDHPHGLFDRNLISLFHFSWSFICKSWLSVREDNGRIRRTFPELGQDPRYSIHIRGLPSGVFKRHLVGAVFTKHSRSKYTCAQRIGILVMMFFLIMVSRLSLSIMIRIIVEVPLVQPHTPLRLWITKIRRKG